LKKKKKKKKVGKMSHASQPVTTKRGGEDESVNTFRCTLPQCTQRFATITGLRQHARHVHPRAYRCRVPRCYDGFVSASELAHHAREKHHTCDFLPLPKREKEKDKEEQQQRQHSDLILVSSSSSTSTSSTSSTSSVVEVLLPPPTTAPPPNATVVTANAATSTTSHQPAHTAHHHAHAHCLCPLAPLCAFAGVDFAAVRAHVEQFSAVVHSPRSPVPPHDDVDNAVPVQLSDRSMLVANNDDAALVAAAVDPPSDQDVLAEPAAANPVALMLDCDDADVDALLASAHAALARCDRCVFVCVEESDLVRHRSLHDIDNHAVPCLYPGCDRSFPSRAGLRVHSRVHMVSPTHACPLPGCSEGPFLKSELKEHAKKHANLLGICNAPDCGRILPNPHLLKAHHKHDHSVTFRCTFPMCARSYASYARLQRHIKEAHLRYLLPQAFADMQKLRPNAAAARSFGPFGEQYIAAPPKRVASLSLSSRLAVPSRRGEATALAPPPSVVLDDDDDASISMSGVVSNANGDDTENHERGASQKRTANEAADANGGGGGGGAPSLLTTPRTTATKTDAARKRARRAPAREPSPAPSEPAAVTAVTAATVETVATAETVADVIDQLPPPPPLRALPNKRMSRGGGNSARRKVKALVVNEQLNGSASGTVGDDADASQEESLRSSQRRSRRQTSRGAAYAQELAAAATATTGTPSRLVRAKPKFSRTSPDESAEESEDAEDVRNMGRLAPRRAPMRRGPRGIARRSSSPPTMPVEVSPVTVPPEVVLLVDDSMASASSSDETVPAAVDDEPLVLVEAAAMAPIIELSPQTPPKVVNVIDLNGDKSSSSQSPEISFDVLQERMATMSRLQQQTAN
jgi:hypothetical protein